MMCNWYELVLYHTTRSNAGNDYFSMHSLARLDLAAGADLLKIALGTEVPVEAI
jgi:hypothetical protein